MSNRYIWFYCTHAFLLSLQYLCVTEIKLSLEKLNSFVCSLLGLTRLSYQKNCMGYVTCTSRTEFILLPPSFTNHCPSDRTRLKDRCKEPLKAISDDSEQISNLLYSKYLRTAGCIDVCQTTYLALTPDFLKR